MKGVDGKKLLKRVKSILGCNDSRRENAGARVCINSRPTYMRVCMCVNRKLFRSILH